MSAAEHAIRAAQALLRDLRAKGYRPKSVDEAIRRGLITDLDWCAALDKYRSDPHLPRGATARRPQSALDALLEVVQAEPGLKVSEAAQRLQRDTMNTFRHAKTLEREGLIERRGKHPARLYARGAA